MYALSPRGSQREGEGYGEGAGKGGASSRTSSSKTEPPSLFPSTTNDRSAFSLSLSLLSVIVLLLSSPSPQDTSQHASMAFSIVISLSVPLISPSFTGPSAPFAVPRADWPQATRPKLTGAPASPPRSSSSFTSLFIFLFLFLAHHPPLIQCDLAHRWHSGSHSLLTANPSPLLASSLVLAPADQPRRTACSPHRHPPPCAPSQPPLRAHPIWRRTFPPHPRTRPSC